ncbi:MAG: hypothetical protein ACRYFZ_06680 [Janthinobacterium lividum]
MWKFLTNSRPAGTELPSPGGQYVAVLGPPQEVWGNQLAALAVWATPAHLLYYRAGYSAHALSQGDAPVFLYWSSDGEWLTFYEFKRQEAYQVVFLHLPAGLAYRVPATDELLSGLPALSQSAAKIQAFLAAAQPRQESLVADADLPAELHRR